MSARELEFLSPHLKATRARLAEHRHGGIVFDSEQVEYFVRCFDQLIKLARALEDEVAKHERNDRAQRHLKIIADIDVTIGGNVVAFPGHSPDHRPTGGAA